MNECSWVGVGGEVRGREEGSEEREKRGEGDSDKGKRGTPCEGEHENEQTERVTELNTPCSTVGRGRGRGEEDKRRGSLLCHHRVFLDITEDYETAEHGQLTPHLPPSFQLSLLSLPSLFSSHTDHSYLWKPFLSLP